MVQAVLRVILTHSSGAVVVLNVSATIMECVLCTYTARQKKIRGKCNDNNNLSITVDCWDGDDDEPIIYHGYTLTTKIRFKEVLSDAVKPFAFFASQYPVILNIENHCSEPYQKKMAHHLKTILGDMLYTEDVDPNLTTLPSPEQLKMKVILRAKRRAGASVVDSAVVSGGSGPNSPSRSISEAGASPTRSIHSSGNGDEGQSVTASAVGIDDGLIITDDEPPRVGRVINYKHYIKIHERAISPLLLIK